MSSNEKNELVVNFENKSLSANSAQESLSPANSAQESLSLAKRAMNETEYGDDVLTVGGDRRAAMRAHIQAEMDRKKACDARGEVFMSQPYEGESS